MAQVSRQPASGRTAIFLDLQKAIRKLSAQSVLFSTAVSNRLGINSSDLECLDIVNLSGAATAGQLAVTTGLTTGAITGVIDRLEKAGFVRRRRDPNDRRRVIIEALPDAEREIGPMFASMAQAAMKLWSTFSDRELMLILDFVSKSYPVMVEETAKLREMDLAPRATRTGGISKAGGRKG
jgi:DNA-binding MarR family transcriptional regulator